VIRIDAFSTYFDGFSIGFGIDSIGVNPGGLVRTMAVVAEAEGAKMAAAAASRPLFERLPP